MSPTLKRFLGVFGVPTKAQERRRPQARYDAGVGGSRMRSSPSFNASHIYRELTPQVRRTLVSDSRDLCDNSPFIRGLIERLVVYVIGSGIWPYSATGDKAFDADSDAAFAEFAGHCEYRGGSNWPMLQSQLYRSELRDGDSGVILTVNKFGSPKVWAVEGHDIGLPRFTNRNDFFDGVKLGPNGERVSVLVRDESPMGIETVEEVAWKDFVHQFDPERPGQVRGIPLLSSALNTGRDIHDIITLEKAAVKDASSKTDIISTETGEAPSATDYLEGTDEGSASGDPTHHYREIFGPEAKFIKRGDKWEAYKSDRPNGAFGDFMSYLSETVCLAARIPPSVLLQIKVGGADTRRDLAAAARVFEMSQNRIARQHLRIRNFVVSVTLKSRKAPANWRDSVAWQMPKSITVDAGREAQQDREDVRAGLMSQQEYHGRWGTDWRRHAKQLDLETVDRIRRAQAISNSEKISFDLALQMLGTSADSPQTVVHMPPDKTVGGVDGDATKEVLVADGADVQKTALNGAQLQAVNDAVAKVSAKQLSPEVAKQMLYIALPATDRKDIDAMIEAASNFEPAIVDAPNPTSEPAPA